MFRSKPDKSKPKDRKSSRNSHGTPGKKAKPVVTPKRKIRASQPSENLLKKLELDTTNLISSNSIKNILQYLHLELPNRQIAKLVEYLFLVKDYNEEINLVSRVNVDEVLLLSLFESIYLLKDNSWQKTTNLLDLGSGGGFPGIPLAITNPEINVTLLDSRRAKVLSLKAIVKELKLENTSIVHDRAETFSDHDNPCFDRITVRAVGSLREILPWVDDILNPQGILLAWKGPEGMREIQNVDKEKWELLKRISIQPHRYIMFLERH